MSEGLKKQIPFIVLMTVIGVLVGGMMLMLLHDNAAIFNPSMFSILGLVISAVIMFICAFFIMLRSQEIGTRLLIVVEGVCLVCGLVSMVVVSGWETDPTIQALLLANTDATYLTPTMSNPFAIVRNITISLFVPMIGSIVGAWLGSRLHPVSVDKNNKPKKKKRGQAPQKQRRG